LEDQLHGGKKCGHLAGKVLVPFQEHINRLIATRLQWDIMGVSNILIARTDSESGKLLSSNIDPRDHEYILGVADVQKNNIQAQSEMLYELELSGATIEQINVAEEKWTNSHPLITFPEGLSTANSTDIQPLKQKSEILNNSKTMFLQSMENR
jgi:isocitrate lyase